MNMDEQPVDSAPAARPKKRRFKWFFRILLGGSLLANLITCSVVSSKNLEPSRQRPAVGETLAWGDPMAGNKVAVLRLDGVIMREAVGSLFGPGVDPVTKLLNEIQAATVDEEVRAILLEVNSPGGGVTASDEIYNALVRFKQSDPDRKLVVAVQDMAASGGYYIALAADRIVAQPTSVVGSIGVIISTVNLHGLSEKLGIEDVSITSTDNKALLNMLEPVDPEHVGILQSVVDDMYARFRGLVLEHRPIDAAFAEQFALFDGRILTAPDAVDKGLVDVVGYGDNAREVVLELLGVSEAAFYEMNFTGGWAGLLAAKGPRVELPFRLPRGAQFLYLWKP
jgi:protease-4